MNCDDSNSMRGKMPKHVSGSILKFPSRFVLPMVTLAMILLAGGCNNNGTSTTNAQAATSSTPVVVKKGNVLVNVSANGTIASQFASKLTFTASGKIALVKVKVGDQVKK